MMTNQQIFDKVAQHLLTQKVRSINRSICLYRGPNNLRCAIGVLIPDAIYTDTIEGKSVGDYVVRALLEGQGIPTSRGETLSILKDLQYIHDMKTPHWWEQALTELAIKFDLNYEVVTKTVRGE